MTSIRTYSVIFVALMVASTTQAGLEFAGILESSYWPALVVILFISSLKALAVSGWYMHAIEEPRAISYIALAGVLCVVALTAGAAYSVV